MFQRCLILLILSVFGASQVHAQGLIVESGAQFVMQGQVMMSVEDGGIQNNGTFHAGNSTVFFDGGSAISMSGSQEIFFNNVRFRGNGIKRNEGIASVIRTMGVDGTAVFDADGATNSRVFTLRSSDTVTANVDVITGGDITGNVTVERFINTGPGASEHGKSWQFLATPTTGQTIYQSWQENGSTPPGYGTIITGTGTGFDITTQLPSLKSYDPSTNAWVGVTNTNNPVVNKNGYMLFVRGDRSVVTHNGTPNNTNMRTRGVLFTPNHPPDQITVLPSQFQTFGNPYASRMEFNKVWAASSGIQDVFYVWDPMLNGTYNLGGYQTISGITGYIPTAGYATSYYPAGVPSPYIESGQAVFVRGTATGGYVQFNEGCKAPDSRLVHRAATGRNPSGRSMWFTTLVSDAGKVADGNIAVFGTGLGNDLNEYDAIKIRNEGENISLFRNGELLSVEARNPIRGSDTLFYHIERLRPQTYTLIIYPSQMPAGTQARFVDQMNRTATRLRISDTNFISIQIYPSQQSEQSRRFYVVFNNGERPGNIFSIDALKQENHHLITFADTEQDKVEKYELEYAYNNGTFIQFKSLLPENPSGTYSILHQPTQLGKYKYRIKINAKDGAVYYSEEVTLENDAQTVLTIYPNPVTDGWIHARIQNAPNGRYEWKLMHSNGTQVTAGKEFLQGNTKFLRVNISRTLPGVYQLLCVHETGKAFTTSVVVQ
ncbi:MAG TPA: hypothetical protein PKY29_06755 [Ferruginibacter sp.]|nr:hypothetical protein [Ferruginibacter sp.]HRO16873.1 hypothetical protein [Ferruginibacter sp.]HRQ20998.1 hypothetical protein [Ferruginibacter sp.]